MEWITEIVGTPFAAALATATLFGTLAKTALIMLVALAASRLMRHASAATRHQVWAAALAAALAMPVLVSALPEWRVPLLPAPAATVDSPRAGGGEQGAADAGEGGKVADAISAQRSIDLPVPRAEGAGFSRSEPGTTSFAIASAAWLRRVTAGLGVAGLLSAIWLAGLGVLLAWLVSSTLAAAWIVRRGRRIDDPGLLREAAAAQRTLQVGGEVPLMASPRAPMPMAWGLLRQVVMLPADAVDWSRQRQRVVLLHEMAHIKRRDCRTQLLARLAVALHWPNPLVWVAARRLQAERERACDDLVLDAGTRGSEYARHLLEIARAMRRSRRTAWAAVAIARPNELEGRLLAILDPRRNRRRMPRAASLTGAALLASLVLPLAALRPSPAGAAQSPGEARATSAEDAPTTVLDLREVVRRQIEQWGANQQIAARARAFLPDDLEGVLGLDEFDLETVAAQARMAAAGQARGLAPGLAGIAGDGLGAQEAAGPGQGIAPRVRAAMSTALADQDWQIRAQAARALGNLEDPEAVADLGVALGSDQSAEVRAAAAWALGMIEDAAAVPALSAALQDESAQVREQAVWALGMIEDEAAVGALGGVLNDESAGVRAQAVWALGMIESDQAVAPLTGALTDQDAKVRSQAAWALGMIESPAAVEALGRALRDDASVEVRKQAAWALGMIEDESGLDALLDAMTDESIEVRKQVLWAISMIAG